MSIVWYKVLPAHFGGQKGIANFNEALGSHLPLYCVCSTNNEPGFAKHYQVFNWLPVSKFQFIHPWYIARLLVFATRHKITHVILEHPYHFLAAACLKLTGKKIICHSHNIEYNRLQLTGKKFSWLTKFIEKFVYRISNRILFKTSEDIAFATTQWKVPLSKTMLMPYCISQGKLPSKNEARKLIIEKHQVATGNLLLLFTGTLDYAPNAEAVVNINKQLVHALRKKNIPFNIIITGRIVNPAYKYLLNIAAREVVMAGYIENIDVYYAAADVYINPVSEGEGIQTKTLEALASNLPVVMFEHMTNGIAKENISECLYTVPAHNWQAFAGAVCTAKNKGPQQVNKEFLEANSFDRHLPLLIQYINAST